MTSQPRGAGLGVLGRRLLIAFSLVVLVSIALVAGAALIGAERGLAANDAESRAATATKVAALAAAAYSSAGGWADADLAQVFAVADSADARVSVWDKGGAFIGSSTGSGTGMGQGMMMGNGNDTPVVVNGARVGSVRLGFNRVGVSESSRGTAWAWVLAAAAIALLLALAVSRYISRRITQPLVQLTAATHDFAAGQRELSLDVSAPGELGELARAFAASAKAVEQADKNRRDLSADVAHELRTPLAALQAGLEELRDGFVPADTATLTGLHDQVLRLGRIVDDLAALSAAEAAALKLDRLPFDASAVAKTALQAADARLRSAGLEIQAEITSDVTALGDRDRMTQVLGNLLENAARYCPAGSTVGVQVRADGENAVFEVSDNGLGISPVDLPRVFERRFRGANASGVSGSGIGLAVVRELVQGMGGSVVADSVPGVRTVFTIKLRRAIGS